MKKFFTLFLIAIISTKSWSQRTLTANPNSLSFGTVCIGSVSVKTFTLTGSNLTTINVTVNALTGISYSTDGVNYSSSIIIQPSGGTVNKLVYVKVAPTSSGNYSASFTITGGGASSISVGVTGKGANLPLSSIIVSPAISSVCAGSVLQLDASTSGVIYNFENASSANALALSIPDNSPTGVSNDLLISDVPATAVITDITVDFLITHNNDEDLIINLKAPNGKVLNLVNKEGDKKSDFANTEISSSSSNLLSDGKPPFTGTYAADAAIGVGAVSNISDAIAFSSLYSVPNGTWTLSIRDTKKNNEGTFHKWSITINYKIPYSITWESPSQLYTNSSATVAYTTGTAFATVYSKPTSDKTYTATVTNGYGCTASATAVITVTPPKWTGETDTKWNKSGNWCGMIPTDDMDAIIQNSASNQPVIDAAVSAGIKNITVQQGASLTINGTLEINGALSNSGIINAVEGTVILSGASAQTIAANTFYNNSLKNLTINNAAGVTLNGDLNITGTLTPTKGVFNTGGFLTLKSTDNATASVAKGSANGGYVNGDVTVERFLPLNTQNGDRTGRTWRLLTAPVTTSVTINDAWQEGLVSNNGSNFKTSNLAGTSVVSGYGTRITGQQQGSFANASSHGYDFWDAISNSSSSIKRYRPGVTAGYWVNLEYDNNGVYNANSNPKTKPLNSEQGYLVYIRGDRNYYNTLPYGQSTTLRAKGALKQGTQTIAVNGSNTANVTLIGNPYASPINFESIYNNNKAAIKPLFWMWNANISSYGAYTLVIRNSANNYTTVPSHDLTDVQYIQSSQAFFVEPATASGSTITIKENDKAINSSQTAYFKSSEPLPSNSSRSTATSGAAEAKLFINLSLKNSNESLVLADGVLVRYAKNYQSAVDGSDIKKPSNLYENLAILRDNSLIMVEERSSQTSNDTIFLKLWNTTQRKYQLQLKSENITADTKKYIIYANLEDAYLHTSTSLYLDGNITNYEFSITSDVASQASNRFRVVLGRNMKEASANKASSETIQENTATATKASVYPNPVKQSSVTVALSDMAKGIYSINLYNNAGQKLITKDVTYEGGSFAQKLKLSAAWPAGLYTVVIATAEGKTVKSMPLIIQK